MESSQSIALWKKTVRLSLPPFALSFRVPLYQVLPKSSWLQSPLSTVYLRHQDKIELASLSCHWIFSLIRKISVWGQPLQCESFHHCCHLQYSVSFSRKFILAISHAIWPKIILKALDAFGIIKPYVVLSSSHTDAGERNHFRGFLAQLSE